MSVTEIGRVSRIDYDAGSQKRFHVFRNDRARLYATADGAHLIIAPVRVKRGQIQD